VNEPVSANPYAAANEKWSHGLASVDHSDPSALSTDMPTLREQMRQSGIEVPIEITIIGDKDEPRVGGVPKGYFDPIVATPLPEASYYDYGNGYNYPVRLEDQTQQVIRQVTASLAERYLLWNNTSKSSIQKELVGLGALPATLKGVHDVWFGAQAAIYTKSFSANGTQYSAIGPDKTRYAISSQSGQVTGAILSNDQVKVPTYLKVGAQVASTLRQSALLSVAGTSLDYGIHEIAGIPKNQEGNPYRNFGADAFLDLSKAIPAGLAGAAIYGALGSFFPGAGNLVGGAIGFTVGVFTALGVEKVIYEPTEIRNKLKGI
ncbi:MAG: hypothetical protein Q7I91_06355, partial [Moraxellaceae bacterium]|nr:hypothetical protein [Moraxellaceae bacterium]